MERPEGNVPSTRSDRDLVLAFQAGERAAYEEMYARYHPRVFGVCARILRNPQDAEEASQETFLRAYQALGRFNGRYQLGAWLARIASNASVDQLRSKSRAPVVGLPNDREPVLEGSDPEDLVVGGHPRLAAAIGDVKPLHAQALAMRTVEGLSHQEIADRLAMTPAQVKALLHRARLALRRAWDRAEAWALAPIFSARALLGDRSDGGSAGSPLLSAASVSPLLAERVAATALVVAVALSGFPTAPGTSLVTSPGQGGPSPVLEGTNFDAPVTRPLALGATAVETAPPTAPQQELAEGLPKLIEDTLRSHQKLSTEDEDKPDPKDDDELFGAGSAAARKTLQDVRQLLPHGGPAVSVAESL